MSKSSLRAFLRLLLRKQRGREREKIKSFAVGCKRGKHHGNFFGRRGDPFVHRQLPNKLYNYTKLWE